MDLRKDRIQILTPPLSDKIFATVFDEPLRNADESVATCSGASREGVAARKHRVELKVRTMAHRRAELQLRFVSSGDVDVAIVIGDETVDSFRAIAAAGQTLHTRVVEITRWSERARELTVTVDFHFGKGEGSVYFFEAGADCAVVLRQFADIRYAAQSVSFFFTAGLLAIATTLIVSGLFSRIEAHERGLGVAMVAMAALYHLFGGPDLPAIALRKRVRAVFARTRSHRAVTIAALWIVTLAGVWLAARIVGTLHRRFVYTSAIERALHAGDAQAAFLQFPWRREAQILIERNAYRLRSGSNKRLREYLQSLVGNPAFQAAAVSKEEMFRRDLLPDSDATSDPAVWCASLLLESGTADSLNRAMQILEHSASEESEILRTMIRLQMSGSKPQLQDAIAGKLESLLENRREARFKTSFLFQNACDALGVYAIRSAHVATKRCAPSCGPDDRAEIRVQLDAAVARFRMVLRARSEAIHSENPQWLRPPQKLATYYLVVKDADEKEEGAGRAKSIGAYYAYCACIAAGTPGSRCDPNQIQKLLEWEEFDMSKEWLAGTVHDPKIGQEIRAMLNEGWRY